MKLKTNPDNPRTISKEAFERLKEKIQRNPDGLDANKIVHKDGIIIAGNQRYRALNELKLELKPEWFKDVTGWSDEQIREYLVTSNISDGAWDYDLLANQYEMPELEAWGLELPTFETIEPEITEDEAPEVSPDPPQSELGKIYQLGRHRVMCGDSTDKIMIEELTNSIHPDLIYTDPPYGMFLDADYSSMKSKLGTSSGDRKMKGNKYTDVIGDHDDFNPAFITTIFDMYPKTKEVFLWGADYYTELLPERNAGSWVVWDKRLDDSADKMYGSSFELCWSKNRHKRDIARIKWAGVFGTEQEFDNKRHHPTQKPTVLSAWFIERYSKAGDNVLDLFLGSGSTLIACEQTDRTCYGMELDPKYVDVIRKRYTKFVNNNQLPDNWEELTPAIN